MRVVIVAMLLLFNTACESPQSISDTGNLSAKITYFRDPNTGLCFASVKSHNGHFEYIVSIANVPCASIPPERLMKP